MSLWDDLTENPDDPWAWAEAGHRMGVEHREQDTPTLTVLLHRTFETYTESMWVQGYRSLRMIVVSHPRVGELPGVVRDLPVSRKTASTPESFAEHFYRVVDQYGGGTWKRKDHTAREGA